MLYSTTTFNSFFSFLLYESKTEQNKFIRLRRQREKRNFDDRDVTNRSPFSSLFWGIFLLLHVGRALQKNYLFSLPHVRTCRNGQSRTFCDFSVHCLITHTVQHVHKRLEPSSRSFAAAAHPQMSWIPAKKVTFKKREGKRHRLLLLMHFCCRWRTKRRRRRRERLTPRPPLGIRISFKPGIGNAHRFLRKLS